MIRPRRFAGAFVLSALLPTSASASLYQDETRGDVVHTTIDLRTVDDMKVSEGASLVPITMTGDKLVCHRSLSLPNSVSSLRADVECLGMELWDVFTAQDKQTVLAALAVVNTTCPLAGFGP